MPAKVIAMTTSSKDILISKARTGRFLFQNGYLDRETVTAKLRLFARRTGITDDLGKAEVNQIISSAFEGIPIEPLDVVEAQS
jgi:hypothetical protein